MPPWSTCRKRAWDKRRVKDINTTDLGRLGEVKAMTALTQMGWYPFTDISGKCPVDIIAWKDGMTKTFQVKSTAFIAPSGNYQVSIKSSRPNKTKNITKKFDPNVVDYLAVYITPKDQVYFIPAQDVKTGTSLTLDKQHDIYLTID